MVEATTLAALACTTAISLAPNVLLFLFPSYKPSNSDSAINPLAIGQALAAGGLLGDVFLHTLPHTLTHDNGEMIGMAVLSGFVVFLLFDILVRSSHNDHDHCHDTGGSHDDACDESKNSGSNKDTTNKNTKKKFMFTSAVVLNLAADSLHNFTDGIAIGASFAGTSSTIDTSLPILLQIQNLLKSRGGLASLAVLFHEIPHELGDYSILVSAGMTKNEAILAQFSTAIAAYCGTFVGLFGMQTMKDYIGDDVMVPFTAGGFIYLAAVTILPGLLEERVGKRGRIAQVLAFLAGIGFMYGVAVLEHAGGGCGHGHEHGHHGHGHAIDLDHHSHNHLHEIHDQHHHHPHESHHHVHVHDDEDRRNHHHDSGEDEHHSHYDAHEGEDHAHHHHHHGHDHHHAHENDHEHHNEL